MRDSKDKLMVAELMTRLEQAGVILWEQEGKLKYRAPQSVLKEQDLAVLKEYKNDVIALLRRGCALTDVSPDLDARFEPFPLADVQTAYLLGRHEVFGYGGVACHIYLELSYDALDLARVEQAWNALILRHDMLRAVIDKSGYQQIMKDVPAFSVVYTDVADWRAGAIETKLDHIRARMGHRVYDTACWPLFEVAVTKTSDCAILHFSIDLLIADWTSIWLLLSEFEAVYKGCRSELSGLELTFRDYLLAERRLRDTAVYLKDKAYWLQRVEQLPGAPQLPLARKQDVGGKALFKRRFLQMDAKLWNAFKQRGQKYGLTPTSAVLAAYAAVIERWSGNEAFCINLTVLNRLPLHAQVNEVVGDFTSVSLLAVDWAEGKSFCDQAKRVNEQLFEDLDHRLFSGVEVLRELARRRGREAALMPIVFTSAIGLIAPTEDRRLQGRVSGQGISQTPQVFIDCQAMDTADGLQVNWDIRQGVFPDGMTDDMFDVFERLLLLLAQTDDAWERAESLELPAWQLAERKQVNDTGAPLPDELLHDGLLAQAAAAPARIAVIDSWGTMTYQELIGQANCIAVALKQKGCKALDRVAIVMEKSRHQMAAALAALLLGAVYVPIDILQPALRRAVMLKKAGVRYVVTCSDVSAIWPEDVTVVAADQPGAASTAVLIVEGSPNAPAYIIYTSGSTGEPKGVVITHRAAVNTIRDINRRFDVGREDVILGLAQLGFDLSVYDIFGILSVGGTVVYPAPDRQADPSHWADLMLQYGVSVWNSVPALMQMLTAYLQSESDVKLMNLRLALLSGDWIPLALPAAVAACAPQVEVVSLGGATEASIWSIFHICRDIEADWSSIPYGRPLANQGFRILDRKLRDCPVWAKGGLYITGAGLAEGYFGDDETTKNRFFFHPVNQERMYYTGDTGRYMPGGEIEFLGREDHQVKIKGHRIELGEIEAALQQHAAVAAAGVVVDRSQGEPTLLGVVEVIRSNRCRKDNSQSEIDSLAAAITQRSVFLLEGLDTEGLQEAYSRLDELVLASMLHALTELGLFRDGKTHLPEEILNHEAVAPTFVWLLRRWLAKLTAKGWLVRQSFDGKLSCPQYVAAAQLKARWDDLEALWSQILGSAGLIAYLRSNAECLPALLSGRQDAVALLYPQGKLDYVNALYRENVVVGYLNHCICILLQRIADHQSGRRLRILEVGAGTGATTEKVLECLDGVDVEYVFTDITASFIPAAKTQFHKYPFVQYGVFDVDQDYRAQGFAANSFDVVLAAGVLENARDIPAALCRLKELIRPGGWLVFTEPTEEHAWILASQAFMMTPPEDGLRLECSYLDKDGWLRALEELGPEAVLCLPGKQQSLSALGLHLFAKRIKTDRLPLCMQELSGFLAERLPAYMVPSHLQVVDGLPLTANGKIDRYQIAKWRPRTVEGSQSVQAGSQAADPQELKLMQLWAEALGMAAIGKDQNFYEAGADSLIMAQVAGKIRQWIAADFPGSEVAFDTLLRQMLNYPTVGQLAAFLHLHLRVAGEARQSREPLAFDTGSNAVLTPYGGGQHGPLRVVFHAAFGTMNCFRLLLQHLERQQKGPVIGITVKDVTAYCEIDTVCLVETAANDYAEQLLRTGYKKMQLIGYCLGGLFAAEVAARLLERGIEIVDMVLIDSHPVLFDVQDDLIVEALFVPNLHIGLDQAGFGSVDPQVFIEGFQQIVEKNGNIIPAGSACSIEQADGLHKAGAVFRQMSAYTMRERFTAYVDAMHRFNGELMPAEMAEGLFKIYRHSFRGSYFKPASYLGDIRYFRALESSGFLPGMQDDTIAFWRDVCLGELAVTDIQGNHFSCVETEPHATDLAALIALPLMHTQSE